MTATQCHLSEVSVSWFQELIRANIDSRDGFTEAAGNLSPSASLATVFSRLARQRQVHIDELQDLLACHDELPQNSGTLSGAAHRIWMDLRAAFGGGEAALLEEAEGSEIRLMNRYEEALHALPEGEFIDALRRQYAVVKTSYERIHEMRADCHAGSCR